jgi:hypothetical protein
VAKGCLKNTLVSAPKGDPNLLPTTMRSAEGSGAVIRHSYDTFQRGLWATPRQSVANWFAGQHSKPMSSLFGLCTLHSQNFSSMGGSRKRGLSSNSGTPGNWTTEAHRVDGLGPGWASSKSDFLMSDLLQNCSKVVLMGVEAPKAGSTDSGRSQSASREVNARDHFLETEQRSLWRVCPEVEPKA